MELVLFICSGSGMIMIVGGIILIYKEKIYIDSQTKKVTEVKTPIGSFKTNTPALALFVIGVILLAYPVYVATEDEDLIHLKGEVNGNSFPIQVYVVLASESLNNNGKYFISVPSKNESGHYKILFKSGDIISDDIADLSEVENGNLHIRNRNFYVPTNNVKYKHNVDSIPTEFK